MKISMLGRAPAVFFTLVVAASAGAQTNPNPNYPPPTGNTPTQQRTPSGLGNEQAPTPGGERIGTSSEESDLINNGYRGSKILHESVYNDKNERIGKVDDLVLAPDGQLTVAIVEVGGFLGMGRHLVAIPVRQFTQWQPRLVLPGATKEALKSMPEYHFMKK